MTGPKRQTKPVLIELDYARAELLEQALLDQAFALNRAVKLLAADPHPNREDIYNLRETKSQLELCLKLRDEMSAVLVKLKE